jgi:hypothetical protein
LLGRVVFEITAVNTRPVNGRRIKRQVIVHADRAGAGGQTGLIYGLISVCNANSLA